MKPSEHLYAAADYIAENGHHKGNYYPGDASVADAVKFRLSACVLGAIGATSVIAGENWGRGQLETAGVVAEMLGMTVPFVDIAAWNDDPHMSAEDVILTLKSVAARLEAEGR